MIQQKCEKWHRDLGVLRNAFFDLRSFRQESMVWMWALQRHPNLEEDGGVLGSHLVGVYGEATAVMVRRVVKPSSGISLLDFLRDLSAFYSVAKRCFSRLPDLLEVKSDADALDTATAPVIVLVDKAYVHLDRPSSNIPLWEAFTTREQALDLAIAMLEKYIGLLSPDGIPTLIAIRASEIRRLFGQPWIEPETKIPSELTRGESIFGV